MKVNRGVNWFGLLSALAIFVLGVLLLVNPAASAVMLVYFMAGILVAWGIFQLVIYFGSKDVSGIFFGGLVSGLTLITIGLILAFKPQVLVVAVPMLIGLVLVISGFYNLEAGLLLRRTGIAKWFYPVIFALVSVTAGILMIVDPFESSEFLISFGGISLCLEALLQFASAFMSRKF